MHHAETMFSKTLFQSNIFNQLLCTVSDNQGKTILQLDTSMSSEKVEPDEF